MCLIIDANVVTQTLVEQPHEDFAPVRNALYAGRARLVVGGHLAVEYRRVLQSIGETFRVLDQAGRVRRVADTAVEIAQRSVSSRALCVSNDVHVIALAEVSKARLLCSKDQDLHADFKNPDVLRPPGRVYQNSGHTHLINQCCKASRKLGRES